MCTNSTIVNILHTLGTARVPSADDLDILDELSKKLAKDPDLRQDIGAGTPSLWPALQALWKRLLAFQRPTDDEDGMDFVRPMLSISRFTRNLVASVPSNQIQAFVIEPDLRELIHRYTSWSMFEKSDSHILLAMFAQTLSNLVTANDKLLEEAWRIYMTLPMEKSIIIRLMEFPDSRVNCACLVYILNSISQSSAQMSTLLSTHAGKRLLVMLLDKTVAIVDAEETAENNQIFQISYRIFECLFDNDFGAQVLDKTCMDGHITTPQLTACLKFLDSYLLEKLKANQNAFNADFASPPVWPKIIQSLVPMFLNHSSEAQASIRQCLNGPEREGVPNSGTHTQVLTETEPLKHCDPLLPKICETLILIAHCLSTITLAPDQPNSDVETASRGNEDFGSAADEGRKYVANVVSDSGMGLVESLIESLRLLDQFLPRIDPRASHIAGTAQDRPVDAGLEGFYYVKRDFVRLLGVLSYGDRAVQDRVRFCGGIPVVMNLCVVDVRNPYLREHALFTLRNLLQGNEANQKEVEGIQPSGFWDEDGVFSERLGQTRK